MKILKTAGYIKLSAWGKAGSGILFVCPQDQTAMLMLRSGMVMDPHTWGIPGGAVKGSEGFFSDDDGENFSHDELWNSAKSETSEEVFGKEDHGGSLGHADESYFPKRYKTHPETTVYDTNPQNPNSFKFHTFIVEIPLTEKQNMIEAFAKHPSSWENDDMRWFPLSVIKKHLVEPQDEFEGDDMHYGVKHVLESHPYFKKNVRRRQPPAPETV